MTGRIAWVLVVLAAGCQVAATADGGDIGMTVKDSTLTVRSKTFTAVFTGARLTSLIDRKSGVQFVRGGAGPFPVEMYYIDKRALGADANQKVTVKRLSDYTARIILTGKGSDRELFVRLDRETGDLCVRPTGQTARGGVLAVRWNVSFAPRAVLVLPVRGGRTFLAGRRIRLRERNSWPSEWNAQLIVAQRGGASMMIHSQDTRYKYKALVYRPDKAGATLGLDSENNGPVAAARTAGGVEWRINTYAGGWKVPADRYRAWMEKTYRLKDKRKDRPGWWKDVTMAVCWVGNNRKLLPALAKLNPPAKTLIHQDKWRRDRYDVNYPNYRASPAGREFIAEALKMGFRVLPHANYFACWNKHPLFARVGPWQARDLYTRQGLYWAPGARRGAFMAYIHPGLGLWRRELIDNVIAACRKLKAPGVLLDQSYHAWNTDNSVVENKNMIEGLHLLQEQFAAIAPELIIAGENLTEISFQRQAFGQLHINGWGNIQPVHVETAHPICAYLWKGHSRYIGYIEMNPTNRRLKRAIEIYKKSGVIPTLIARGDVAANTRLISPDSPAMKMMLEWVKHGVRYDR